jgi:hypothetical protein
MSNGAARLLYRHLEPGRAPVAASLLRDCPEIKSAVARELPKRSKTKGIVTFALVGGKDVGSADAAHLLMAGTELSRTSRTRGLRPLVQFPAAPPQIAASAKTFPDPLKNYAVLMRREFAP